MLLLLMLCVGYDDDVDDKVTIGSMKLFSGGIRAIAGRNGGH